MDSQIPSRSPGTLSWIAEGMANASLGRKGRESRREKRVVFREVVDAVGADNRGRKEESSERAVT
jgi:hypothetical protein